MLTDFFRSIRRIPTAQMLTLHATDCGVKTDKGFFEAIINIAAQHYMFQEASEKIFGHGVPTPSSRRAFFWKSS